MDNGVPARFQITDLLASITNAVGVLEVRQVCSDVENVSVSRVCRRCLLNQGAACRINGSNGHRNRFYLTKADLARCCDSLLVRVLELRVSQVPRRIRNASVLKEIVIFKPENSGPDNFIVVVPAGGVVVVVDRSRPRACPRITGVTAVAASKLARGKNNRIGRAVLGGVINAIPEQPLREPFKPAVRGVC